MNKSKVKFDPIMGSYTQTGATLLSVSNIAKPKPASITTFCYSCGGSGDADNFVSMYPNSLDKTNIKNLCLECKGAAEFTFYTVMETPKKYLHLWDR